jgi:voltage-gated potassium channel Kch
LIYGDPGRRELLEAAGIRSTEALVVLDGAPRHRERVVRQARLLRPGLLIQAFADDHEHKKRLLDAGASDVVLVAEALAAVHELHLVRMLDLTAEGTAGAAVAGGVDSSS